MTAEDLALLREQRAEAIAETNALAEAAKGDIDAMRELLARFRDGEHAPLVLQYLGRLGVAGPWHEAAFKLVLLHTYKAVAKWQPGRGMSFSTYCYTYEWGRVPRKLRASKRQPEIVVQDPYDDGALDETLARAAALRAELVGELERTRGVDPRLPAVARLHLLGG